MLRIALRLLAVLVTVAASASVLVGGPPAHGEAAPGAVGLAESNYAVPAGAKFVSVGGSDSASGSQDAPWRTIQYAVNSTPSGGTVVIRGGTYREFISLSNKTLTLQPYPQEQVWVKASVEVTGWVADGSTWRKDGWTPKFTNLTTPSGYIDPNYPLAGYPDMVFVDGQPLRQVASRSAVVAGTFYVDTSGQKLYIGTNPAGRTVEGSAYKNTLLLYNAPNSKILGMGFMHAASTANSASGSVILDTSPGVVVENNTFAWNAASGFQVGQASHDAVVRGNQFLYNGLVGADSWGGPQRLTFTNNYAARNNQERFSIYWAAAGLKFTNIINSTVADNVVENNDGPGIWCDNSCVGVKIVRNMVRANTYQGIMYEISDDAIIASNVIVNNASSGGGGVYVSASANVRVYNNTIVSSAVSNARSIDVNSDSRKTTSGVVIKNNILSHSNSSGLWAVRVQDDGTNTLSASSMVSAMDNDAYYRKASTSPPTEVRWGKPGGYTDYATLAQFRSANPSEANGLAVDGESTNPFFVDEANGDYRLKSGSVAIGGGAPLPQDIASAIGVVAGTAVDIGVLRWPPTTTATAPSSSTTAAPAPTTTAAPTTTVPPTTTTTVAPTTTTTVAPAPTTTSPTVAATVSGPTVTISSPTNGARLGNKTTVSAKASSGVAIKSMKLYIDGVMKASSTGSSLRYTWKTRSIARGTHTISVTAVDANGKSATRTISVYR